jgi:hypothetical protein
VLVKLFENTCFVASDTIVTDLFTSFDSPEEQYIRRIANQRNEKSYQRKEDYTIEFEQHCSGMCTKYF